jgi:hypothetical protein
LNRYNVRAVQNLCWQILKRLQQIKWAKETALHEEDSVSDYGSVLNSVRRLDTLDAETPGSVGSGGHGHQAATRPIPIPLRRSSGSGGVAYSAPAGGLPPSASAIGGDFDGSYREGMAASFTQSPVRTLSPADVVEGDNELDIGDGEIDGRATSATDDHSAAAAAAAAAATAAVPGENEDAADVAPSSVALADASECQSLIRSRSSKSKDVAQPPALSRQTTVDSVTGR